MNSSDESKFKEEDVCGTSEIALQTQIWTALIAMLLIKFLQLRARFGWSLSNLVALLRQQLFVPGFVDLDRRSLSTAAGDTCVAAIAVRAPLKLDSSSVENASLYPR